MSQRCWSRSECTLATSWNCFCNPSGRGDDFATIATGAKGLWLQPRRLDSPLTGPIGVRRRWAHTRMSLEHVATIRHALGGTVNDVVLAVVSQGFRELLLVRGEPLEGRDVMALIPVSVRTASERGCYDNRVAVAHALLPVGIDDPSDALAAIRTHLADLKVSHQTDASTLLLHSGDFVPHVLVSVVACAVVRVQQNLETIATNVPGPAPADVRVRPTNVGGVSVRTARRTDSCRRRHLVVLRHVVPRRHRGP